MTKLLTLTVALAVVVALVVTASLNGDVSTSNHIAGIKWIG